MTDYEKNLIFKVAGGMVKNLPFIHIIHQTPNGNQMLETCAALGIIGSSFHQMWADFEFKGPYVISFLMKKLTKDKDRKLLIKDLG
jgi:hypothetical protein